MQVSWDGGKEWHWTFRTFEDIRAMHPDAQTPVEPEEDREIFGDTIDEPIPDDLWEMLV